MKSGEISRLFSVLFRLSRIDQILLQDLNVFPVLYYLSFCFMSLFQDPLNCLLPWVTTGPPSGLTSSGNLFSEAKSGLYLEFPAIFRLYFLNLSEISVFISFVLFLSWIYVYPFCVFLQDFCTMIPRHFPPFSPSLRPFLFCSFCLLSFPLSLVYFLCLLLYIIFHFCHEYQVPSVHPRNSPSIVQNRILSHSALCVIMKIQL